MPKLIPPHFVLAPRPTMLHICPHHRRLVSPLRRASPSAPSSHSPPALAIHPALASAFIAAISATCAQFLNAPLTTLQTSPVPPKNLLCDLPLHVLKRVPTKTLTALLASLSSAGAPSPALDASLSAVSALATYPLSVAFYAVRKAVPSFPAKVRARPTALLSGAAPAVIAVLVVAAVDKAVYSRLPPPQPRHRAARVVAIAASAALSATLAGACAEPLKAVARRAAVTGVTGAGGSLAVTKEIWSAGGVAMFWKGFPQRAVRYSVCAPVAKVMSSGLKGELGEEEREFGVPVVAERKTRVLVVGGKW